jgi:protein subunit release factor A
MRISPATFGWFKPFRDTIAGMAREKNLLFSVTAKDFDMQTFTVSGPGGGGKDTARQGVRMTHRASGAVGTGRETRSVTQNRRAAFLHAVSTSKFKNWHRIETARLMGKQIPETPEQVKARVDRMVDEGLRDGTIRIEEGEAALA